MASQCCLRSDWPFGSTGVFIVDQLLEAVSFAQGHFASDFLHFFAQVRKAYLERDFPCRVSLISVTLCAGTTCRPSSTSTWRHRMPSQRWERGGPSQSTPPHRRWMACSKRSRVLWASRPMPSPLVRELALLYLSSCNQERRGIEAGWLQRLPDSPMHVLLELVHVICRQKKKKSLRSTWWSSSFWKKWHRYMYVGFIIMGGGEPSAQLFRGVSIRTFFRGLLLSG